MHDAQPRIRRDAERGRFRNDWLEARFSFPFGTWHDPRWPRFGALLALNEDRVQPGRGFAMHPHTDLEILMLPRLGRIEHRDHLGGHALLGPGELHFMRAGHGIRHSQMNPSLHEVDHHFQIWLEPRTRGLDPAVQTLRLPPLRAGAWMVLASGRGEGGAAVDVDGSVRWGLATADAPLPLPSLAGGMRYLHVVSGAVVLPNDTLNAGDAWVWPAAGAPLTLAANGAAELLCFEFPTNPLPTHDGDVR